MEILILVSPQNYARMLSSATKGSAAYEILKDSIVVNPPDVADDRIRLACEVADALVLLQLARESCPQAAPAISNAIKLARPPSSQN